MTAPAGPPRWLVRVVFVVLTALLVFPIHVPYQNPDADVPVVLSLLELVRGGWQPWTLHYPSALTNLLRGGWEVALAGAHVAGVRIDALDVAAAWYRDPAAFRVFPRALAMMGGVTSLVAVARLTRLVTDAWSALFAAIVLGTSLMFVREHHHGMWDAPASSAVIVSLALCGRYVARPAARTIAFAGATGGLAFSFKYNALAVLLCPLLAVALGRGSRRAKVRRSALVLAATVLAVFVTSPALFLQPGRVAMHFRTHAFIFETIRAPVPYGLADVLRNGLGVGFVSLALLGAVVACVRRERPLLPLVLFVATYGVATWRYPIALNRYALPFAPVGAVLVVYGLHQLLAFPWRAAAVAVLVGIGLPSCLAYLVLLAKEDTRVASARWLRAHVRPDAHVFLPSDIGGVVYVGPDLQRPFQPFDGLTLPPERLRELLARMGPPFPRTWRFIGPATMFADAAPDGDPARWANGIVVTSELGAYPFRPYDTPPAAIRFLEQHAVLLRDYAIERRPGTRVYEQVDLNYVPFRGATSLAHPGPHIRIWYVPADSADEPSPFVDPPDGAGRPAPEGTVPP